MTFFAIHSLPAGNGTLGICPLPGVLSPYADDLTLVTAWNPDLVLTMTEHAEMVAAGAASLGDDLQDEGFSWYALPIADFGTPGDEVVATWPEVSALALAILRSGGKVLAHCRGGCGRSGMVLMRLMVELGEAPDEALARLRAVRPCAVETQAQQDWAAAPAHDGA
ncbi:protein phosphatase [Aliiroseovarius sp. KMU-50]|uniref:Protein phosphatase n=1 Tax=Aliiroseovarius salicola TaxID=3009082 RepID=A0ABT4VWF5_9RHOB|nr:protein phosphatase [Aliiroseovarius sp. KMU-50]MDA5092572.1 protein phosphatase [Aliiroseovarius sp. KMU-50]